jgi:antirestriction protein
MGDNMLTLTKLKDAIKQTDKETVRDLIESLGEDVVDAALELGISVDSIKEAYSGEFSNDVDFAQNMAEEIGALKKNETWPYTCIDWEYAARELMYDYSEQNGHYFRNI